MSELGWTDYVLPSRGVLYADLLPGGKVQIRKLTAKQQALLVTQGGGNLGKIDAIIDTCCRLPSEIKHKELLLTDRFAILLALRTKTFGSTYTFRWRCRCGQWGNATIDIVKELDEKAGSAETHEPVEVELPDAKCVVHARFLRGTDEEVVARNAKRMVMASNDNTDPSYLQRLAIQLVSKDGEDFANPLERIRFVEGLTGSDLILLEDSVSEAETGIDTRLFLDCNHCAETNQIGMPFTAEFFRPRSASRGPRDDRDEPVLPGLPRQRVHPKRRGSDDAG